MQPLLSEQTFIIISCTSTYGVLLCVKFNKKKTLWTVLKGYKVYGRTGVGISVRTDFFFGFNHEKFTPPPLRETTQKLLEGGVISCPDFYRKKNLSGRKSQPPSVHKPCNPSKPSKVFFFY
jgi:hypothetical protein